jgi:2-polyprenyl-6-methoxyphenol hydroxylase-like FAD-dependent oxidoreductase
MRHYEKMPRLPEHFALTGDAVCGFNPIYGQGMTAAALGAKLLDETLTASTDLAGIGKLFQQKLAKQNATIWLMSTGEDFRHATTEGKRPGFAGRLVQKYMDWVIEALPFDDEPAVKFLHVVNLDMPPTALFQPSIIGAVIRHRLGRKTTPQPSADAPLVPSR